MIEILQHLFALDITWFVQEFGTAIYIILFLVIFIETGLVAFPFLPGDSLLFTAGLFCKSGQLDLMILLPLLFIAAILGDNINYWVGRKIGLNVFSISFRGKPLVKKEYLDKTSVFFEKHGTKAIILARFVPFVRTFAPFAAGVAKMKYRTFVSHDLLGGALWVGSMMIAGYLLGEVMWIREHVDLMAIAIVLISVSPLLISRLTGRKKPIAMKKAITIIKYSTTYIGLVIISFFLLCVFLALIPVEKEITKAPRKITIYCMQSGVHTDIIVPVHHKIQNWDALFPYENNKVYDTTFHWIGLGMGDKRFFLTTPSFNDLTFSTAFRGAFGLSGAAIHAYYHYEIPSDRPIIKLRITENQYKRLCAYIKRTVKFKHNKPILLHSKVKGTTFDYDRYYDAKGAYSVLNTCNSWVNEGLKSAGQRGCYWTAFAGGIFYQYGK